uniref:Secreted protein n=1 Tax=Macrostomum lignano TaxID=282301 RepID=A0A1I8GZN8_9PLAT
MTGLLQNSTPLLLLCCLAAAINVSASSFCTYNFAKLVQHTWTMPEGFASYDGVTESTTRATNKTTGHVTASSANSQCPNTKLMLAAELFSSTSQRKSTRKQK